MRTRILPWFLLSGMAMFVWYAVVYPMNLPFSIRMQAHGVVVGWFLILVSSAADAHRRWLERRSWNREMIRRMRSRARNARARAEEKRA